MDYQLNTRLNGNIAMTSRYHESVRRCNVTRLCINFIWVQSGTLTRGDRPYPHAAWKRMKS